jgi:hypothetical protein
MEDPHVDIHLGTDADCENLEFHTSIAGVCHTVVRTTGRTLLAQDNLVVARPVHFADGREIALFLTTLSRQSNERRPLALIPFAC